MSNEPIRNVKGVHPPKTNLGLVKMHTLVEVAERLFTQSSFFEVSVSDICKEAHTAVGTFYIYFETKTDIYRYLVEDYKRRIKRSLSQSIAGCTTRYERERAGIKSFVRFSVENPNVYHIVWGSLAVEKQLFEDYYMSFADSYARALRGDQEELVSEDVMSLAYMLMGIASFLGLRGIFEQMNDEQIDAMVDGTIMSILEKGLFRPRT
ncbi:MAG: TetR/AcrR family transcriptional regulator [Oscillospiraceae bacterium]|nr:TetR/AcrR family transcriptional regulator [Oscillospiraceae bacterium]